MSSNLNGHAALLETADAARLEVTSSLDDGRRSALGQFMTPASAAAFMASMFELKETRIRLLDAGAGVGSLTAAFVSEACRRSRRPQSIEVTAFELEPRMLPHLKAILRSCAREAKRLGVRFAHEMREADFVDEAALQLEGGLYASAARQPFNAAILNPPYRKIRGDSRERMLLRAAGIETSNLYAAFVALTVRMLEPGGELVAITPRSFCNGPYFRPFRQLLLRETALLRVHVFEARDRAFSDDDVLQENVIFHARKRAPRQSVVLSSSTAPGAKVVKRTVSHEAVVNPGDPNAFIHIAVSESDRRAAAAMQAMPCTLSDLGMEVSTGRVVDFRAREHLRRDPEPGTAPLIYPSHFSAGFVEWPRMNGRKPNAIADSSATADLMVTSATYVLTKRFTSKEEPRRVVAAVFDPKRLPRTQDRVGFENHVNYFHLRDSGLPVSVARGLAVYLNSSLVDRCFRQFNGHTQVNASDLRSMRYPSLANLKAMGRRIGAAFPDQGGVDEIVDSALPPSRKSSAR